MSDPRLRAFLWSAILVSSGVLLLLYEFGQLAAYTPLLQYILAGLFVFGAVLFFGAFARSRAEWWRVIPGWTLLALAAILLISTVNVDQRWSGAAVFGGLAFAFTHVYLTDRNSRWWALIPGGFLFVLGLVIGLSVWVASIEWLALLLFGGLGAVFFLLFVLHRRQWWAVLPGGVLMIFAALAAVRGDSESAPLLRWWPVLLIVAGVFMALRARRRVPERLEVQSARTRKTRREPQPSTPAAATAGTRRSTAFGEYSQPAPGATVEVLPDPDE